MTPVARLTRPTALVLAYLAVRNGEVYGGQVAEATRLSAPAVYAMLRRLERGGWLTARWERADPEVLGRPARRYYRVTERGRAGIARLSDQVAQLTGGRS